MQDSVSRFDPIYVAVIGGGPAGASAATFLAQRGRRGALIEKAQHPRFHIGKSVLPQNIPVMERLGVSREVSENGIRKPGVDFVSPQHKKRQLYIFRDALFPKPSYSFHVRRTDFDEILFRHAAGVAVWENAAVTENERTIDGWRLTIDRHDQPSEIPAEYPLDAFGRDGRLARQEGGGAVIKTYSYYKKQPTWSRNQYYVRRRHIFSRRGFSGDSSKFEMAVHPTGRAKFEIL